MGQNSTNSATSTIKLVARLESRAVDTHDPKALQGAAYHRACARTTHFTSLQRTPPNMVQPLLMRLQQ
eukprot:580546-Pelagomonas_calceolata.AAC.6